MLDKTLHHFKLSLIEEMFVYRKVNRTLEDKHSKSTESFTFDDQMNFFFDGETTYRGQMLLENKKHEVHTVNKHKIPLNIDNSWRQMVNQCKLENI